MSLRHSWEAVCSVRYDMRTFVKIDGFPIRSLIFIFITVDFHYDLHYGKLQWITLQANTPSISPKLERIEEVK